METVKIPTEAHEHRLLVAYLRTRGFIFTHVANEAGTSNKWIGIRNKQNGVSPGFPDFLIIVRNHLIAIELKRIRRSAPTPKQLEWLAALEACGVPARVCRGYLLAKEFVEEVEAKYEN